MPPTTGKQYGCGIHTIVIKKGKKTMNDVHLMGRLVADPELRKTTGGTPYCIFSLARNTYFKNEEKVEYFDCIAWKGTAERLEKYSHKGDNIAIVGCLQNNNYTTENGEKRYGMRVVVRELYFAGRKNSNAAQNGTAVQQSAAPQQTDVPLEKMTPDDFDLILTDEEVPFT